MLALATALLALVAAAPLEKREDTAWSTPPAGKERPGEVYYHYEVDRYPDNSIPPQGTEVKSLVFPFRFHNSTLREYGVYVSQQYHFSHKPDSGYLGFQTEPDNSQGVPIWHGTFSTFVGGSTSTDPNCTPGADGGDGVSCHYDFEGSYDKQYYFKIENTEGDTFVGTVSDDDGNNIHIGSYTLPAGSGPLNTSHIGFIEFTQGNPRWTVDAGQCRTQIHKIDVELGPVYSPDANIWGTTYGAWEDTSPSLCTGADAGFSATNVPYTLNLGGKSIDTTALRVVRGWATNP